jgi:hypothetical protein
MIEKLRSPVIGVLVEAAADGEDDERHLSVAQHGLTDSSYAFLRRPFRRLQKVTCRFVEFSMRLISIFPRHGL